MRSLRGVTAQPAFAAPVVLLRSTSFSPSISALSVSRPPCRRDAFVSSVPRMAAFRLPESTSTRSWEAVVAASPRAVTPMRRPDGSSTERRRQQQFTEEQPLPSARRSDLMAPKRVGIWAVVSYVAAMVVIGAAGFVAAKRFQIRQSTLVEDFGEVMIYYGTTPEAMADIVSDYKRKLGPGVVP
jgi:hypothetical protein